MKIPKTFIINFFFWGGVILIVMAFILLVTSGKGADWTLGTAVLWLLLSHQAQDELRWEQHDQKERETEA
jgi:hypothetical protein